MTGKSKDTIESFLSTFPPQTCAIGMALRRTVRSAIPDLVEAVYPGWKLIGYRIASGKKSFYFGFIYLRQDCVLLGFEYGAMVPDPERILEGTGKQVRHIAFTSVAQTRSGRIPPLIVEAAMVALSKGGSII